MAAAFVAAGGGAPPAALAIAALAALALARGEHFLFFLIVRVCVIQVAKDVVRRLGHLRGKIICAARLGLGRRLEGANVKARVLNGVCRSARCGRIKHTRLKGVAAQGLRVKALVKALAVIFLAIKAVQRGKALFIQRGKALLA